MLLELGSGTGIVSIMLKLTCPKLMITALEIRESACELARANLDRTGTDINLLHQDLRNFTATRPFDFIVTNPPYIPHGKGRLSPDAERNIARHELSCTMEDILRCIQRNLAADGTAFLLYPDERIDELEEKMKNVDLRMVRRISSPQSRKGTTIAILIPSPQSSPISWAREK